MDQTYHNFGMGLYDCKSQAIVAAESVTDLKGNVLQHPASNIIKPIEFGLIAESFANSAYFLRVDPHSAATVDIPSTTQFTTFTYGLGGCSSILVASKDSLDKVKVTLSHFGTMSVYQHLSALKAELPKHLNNDRNIESLTAICLIRGEDNPISGAVSIADDATNEEASIKHVIESVFANSAKLNYQLVPYDSLTIPEGSSAAFAIRWGEFEGNALFQAHQKFSGVVFHPELTSINIKPQK